MMQGVYLSTDGQSGLVYAGFVAGVGWAHEQAHDRGAVEGVLRAIVGDELDANGPRTEVFVAATYSTVLIYGPSELVEPACAQLARRLLGEERCATIPPSKAALPAADETAVWLRWGAQSYGILGLTPYAMQAPSFDELFEATRQLFNSATVVPFGVDTDVAALLEHLPDGARPATPRDEPILPLPGHLVYAASSTTVSWVARSQERLADAILISALVPCFARRTPERDAVEVIGRDFGAAGIHTTLHLIGRDPQEGEVAAVAQQLRRLRDQGPTEAEIVRAMDHLKPRDESPLQAAVRLAWCRITGEPETPDWEGTDIATAIRAVLSRVLVVGPAMPELEGFAPVQSSPIDRTKLDGRTFRASRFPTAGLGLEGARINVGAQGLTWKLQRHRETIRAEDVAVIEVWNDDDRTVLSRLGYRMHLDPLDWRRWDLLKSAVDALAPERVRITGERNRAIPHALPHRKFTDFAGLAKFIVPVLAIVFLFVVVRAAANPALSPTDRILATSLLLLIGSLLGYHIWAILKAVRTRQRRAASPATSGAAR